MSTITWNTDVNAPGCAGEILSEDEEQSVLVQVDYDAPAVASIFGWDIRDVQAEDENGEVTAPCAHSGTDGTVDCPACGIKAATFIAAALDWLADNDGAQAEDPGYFEE